MEYTNNNNGSFLVQVVLKRPPKGTISPSKKSVDHPNVYFKN